MCSKIPSIEKEQDSKYVTPEWSSPLNHQASSTCSHKPFITGRDLPVFYRLPAILQITAISKHRKDPHRF